MENSIHMGKSVPYQVMENPYGRDSNLGNDRGSGSAYDAYNEHYFSDADLSNNDVASSKADRGSSDNVDLASSTNANYSGASGNESVYGQQYRYDAGDKKAAWADSRFTNASVGARIGALILDSIIIAAIEMAIAFFVGIAFGSAVLSDLSASMVTLVSGAQSLLWAAYKIGMEAVKGQTLGKMAYGIRLVPYDGQPLGIAHSLRRNVNCFYGFVPVIGYFVLGCSWFGRFFSVMGSPYNQGYHDGWGRVRLVRG